MADEVYEMTEPSRKLPIKWVTFCDSVEAWQAWAYERILSALTVPPEYLHGHVCHYYPRKVPRCPACEAGVPRREVEKHGIREAHDDGIGDGRDGRVDARSVPEPTEAPPGGVDVRK